MGIKEFVHQCQQQAAIGQEIGKRYNLTVVDFDYHDDNRLGQQLSQLEQLRRQALLVPTNVLPKNQERESGNMLRRFLREAVLGRIRFGRFQDTISSQQATPGEILTDGVRILRGQGSRFKEEVIQ